MQCRHLAALASLYLLTWSCRPVIQPPAFSTITEYFVRQQLALSPVSATTAGYHVHDGVRLDEQLDDWSPAGIAKRRALLDELTQRLAASSPLTAIDRADRELMTGQLALSRLELDQLRSYQHNPTFYVELLGDALADPAQLAYAPLPDRFQHITARLRAVPRFLSDARRNLVSAPAVWTETALEESRGNVTLIDQTLRTAAPAELQAAYAAAAAPALEALRQFQTFLQTELTQHPTDWRLGKQQYDAKFRLTMGTDQTPEQVLAAAEAELLKVKAEMQAIAVKLQPATAGLGSGAIPVALNAIARQHSAPQNYFADARRDLDEARQFVREQHLLPLPQRDNLQVIETPAYMRGIYAVGGFKSAPALEPQLGAFYWLTPLSTNAARQESTLREYNEYGLRILTIHEAMPGHYVQFEYANSIQPQWRRLLYNLYGSGTYVEGWAVYVTEAMLDSGYLRHSPELRLTFLKQQLRVLANTILDIKLHTQGMTDQQALNLMTIDAYQEQEEATAKLRRAKLSSCQLPTYYVGYRDWRRLRDRYKQRTGTNFKLSQFHQRALETGALPLSILSHLIAGPNADRASRVLIGTYNSLSVDVWNPHLYNLG